MEGNYQDVSPIKNSSVDSMSDDAIVYDLIYIVERLYTISAN